MKRKLTSLLLVAIVTFSFCVDSFGKTNVTSTYLKDANLTSLSGWTLDKSNGWDKGYTDWQTSNDVPVIEFYNDWGPNAGKPIGKTKTFNFSQKVTLPAGYYRLAVNAFYREGNGNGKNELEYNFYRFMFNDEINDGPGSSIYNYVYQFTKIANEKYISIRSDVNKKRRDTGWLHQYYRCVWAVCFSCHRMLYGTGNPCR